MSCPNADTPVDTTTAALNSLLDGPHDTAVAALSTHARTLLLTDRPRALRIHLMMQRATDWMRAYWRMLPLALGRCAVCGTSTDNNCSSRWRHAGTAIARHDHRWCGRGAGLGVLLVVGVSS